MRIAVLCGGESSERDVSTVSGWATARSLVERGHDVLVIDPSDEHPILAELAGDNVEVPHRRVASEPPTQREQAALRQRMFEALVTGPVIDHLRKADLAFLALHGGWGEDGHVQALLEMAGVRFTGADSAACATAWRKDHSALLLSGAGIPVAKQVAYRPGGEELPAAVKQLIATGPVVVKPVADGSSVSVRLVTDPAELTSATDGSDLVVEPFLPGREFTVGVVGDTVLPVVEIELDSPIFDYEAKYQDGVAREVCPADISTALHSTLQDMAIRAHTAFGFGRHAYSRVDFRCDADGSPVCLEVNALPGLTPTSLLPLAAATAGMSFADLVQEIVELARQRACGAVRQTVTTARNAPW